MGHQRRSLGKERASPQPGEAAAAPAFAGEGRQHQAAVPGQRRQCSAALPASLSQVSRSIQWVALPVVPGRQKDGASLLEKGGEEQEVREPRALSISAVSAGPQLRHHEQGELATFRRRMHSPITDRF